MGDVVDAATGDFLPSLARYEPKYPREFSNYATVETRVQVPELGQVPLSALGTLDFPEGTVVAKRFAYQPGEMTGAGRVSCGRSLSPIGPLTLSGGGQSSQLSTCYVELRILRRSQDQWEPFVFEWSSGSWVARPGGSTVALRLEGSSSSVNYQIPSLGDCVACHGGSRALDSFGPIGLTVERLDASTLRDVFRIDIAESETNSTAALADYGDDRSAREYLAVNCGFCHNPNGLAASSGLLLDAVESDPLRLGVCKRPVAYSSNDTEFTFDVQPGHPEHSVMVKRMATMAPGQAMPELGRIFVDVRGVALVSRWIKDMKEEDCRGGERSRR